MEYITQMSTELATGEIDNTPKQYENVWGAEVKTEDGLGKVVEIDPLSERDIMVTLKDGYSFWYNLDEVDLVK